MNPRPADVDGPVLVDTGVFTWARDRRYPHLAPWLEGAIREGHVLTTDPIVLELVRLAPNEARARAQDERLRDLGVVAAPVDAWERARGLQQALAPNGDHRRVPVVDLLIAVTAMHAGLPLLHYDRDFERIAAVADLDARWFVPDGSLL